MLKRSVAIKKQNIEKEKVASEWLLTSILPEEIHHLLRIGSPSTYLCCKAYVDYPNRCGDRNLL
jgi:hypothetical protein